MSLKVLDRWRGDRALERDLGTLSSAGMLAFDGVGIADLVLPETEAFRALRAREADLAARGDALERLTREATPAGRLYAATLLALVDSAAADRAWRALSSDSSEVTTASGCILESTSVAEYARQHLERRPS